MRKRFKLTNFDEWAEISKNINQTCSEKRRKEMEGRACYFLPKRYFPHGQSINYLFSLSGRLPEMLKLTWPYFFLF